VERAIETLTLEEVVEINRQQIAMFGGLFLPVSNFHNEASLEFALDAVDAVSYGRPLHPTLADKAASLAYSIITNHVFRDGNKRTAMAVCRIFLLLNGCDLEMETEVVDQNALYMAIAVADGTAGREELTNWVRERMRPLENR